MSPEKGSFFCFYVIFQPSIFSVDIRSFSGEYYFGNPLPPGWNCITGDHEHTRDMCLASDFFVPQKSWNIRLVMVGGRFLAHIAKLELWERLDKQW